jgi:hypothetical protein
MEQYNQDAQKLLNAYQKTRSWLVNFLGIIVTIIGVGVIFVVSSLEGTKEIRVSNAKSAEIVNYWRSTGGHASNTFPEERSELIIYDGQQYYFMIDENDDWYFAYDGGFAYIFTDYKFYVLTSLTIVISMWVASINYTSTTRSVMQTEGFVRTLNVYAERKRDVEKFTQLIPEFCIYKNQQAYETAKREIVEEASIHYADYIKTDFDVNKLEDWQIKKLKKIRNIKVKKIYSSDLLQENGGSIGKIQLLPMGEREHRRIFMVTGGVQKIISSALSGMVVAFGVVLGNWVLGITYGLTVVMSFVSAIIVATDFVSTTLRNRYLAKADLLREFDNIKEMFIVKEEVKEEIKEEPKETQIVQEENAIIHLPMLQKVI